MSTEGSLRVPKIAVSAEKSVIAAMLVDRDSVPRAAASLKPEAFYYRAHAKAFSAMVDLHRRGEPVDLVTLAAELERRGELAECGGPAKVAAFAEWPAVPANLEAHARLVRLAYATRQRQKIGLTLANSDSDDPEITRGLLERLGEIQAAAEGTDNPAERLARVAMTGADLAAADLPPLESWLGDGILCRGQLAFLSGHSGIGKTFLAVQIMSALSFGHTFCGLTTRRARVGFVELEMPWASVQSRLKALDDQKSDLSNMVVLCEPPGAIHVRESETRAALIAFCRIHAIDVLVMDPFNRLHADDENDNSSMGSVLDGLHEINRESGAAILVLHHVRKQPSAGATGGFSRSGSLDAMRGSSRLTNEPATVLTLSETRGLVRLDFTKVRHAQAPEPIYLHRNERGFFDVADNPSVGKDKRTETLLAMLERAEEDGITTEDAVAVLKLSDKTVRTYFKKIGAVQVSKGKNERRWVLKPAASGDLWE